VVLQAPSGFGHALSALDLYLGPSREVALVGEPSDGGLLALAREVWSRYLPRVVMAAGQPGDESVPLLVGRQSVHGRAAAYVCERFACRRPVTEPADLAAELAS